MGELSTERVSDELRKRHGDTVWRLRLGEHWVYLLILLEFQSEDDPWLALRITPLLQGYFRNEAPGIACGAAGRALQRHRGWPSLRRVADDDLPGRNLLRAVAALEQSRSFEDVLRVRDALQLWLQDPRAAELQRAFVDWMRQIAERVAPAGAVVPPVRTLEEVRMTLVERAAEWPKQWLREGREQGLAEGREQGLEQGIEQGVDQQRALLCRMAAARFGADTAARLTDVLAPITDPDRLAEIGDWLVRCDIGAPSSSPASIPPHHPDARRLTRRAPRWTCAPTAGRSGTRGTLPMRGAGP